jgi:hypothetical protein
MLELSICIRKNANFFSCSERKVASADECGRYQKAKILNRNVHEPSMMKRYFQLTRAPVLMWKTPKARSPPNADAID